MSSMAKTCEACGAAAAQPAVSSGGEERNWIVGAHLSGLLGFIGPLVLWLVKKDESAPIASAAKEALNFQITIAIVMTVLSVTSFLIVPLLLMPVVWLAWIGLMIMAAVKASNGENYQYPYILRLIK